MLRSFFLLFLFVSSLDASHHRHRDLRRHHKPKIELHTTDWTSTYAEWIDPNNHFVDYIDAYDQARVVFIGSSAYSSDGQGQRPSTSEGMGYGLLLAYAYNDQTNFDKFLRYTLATAQNYGCSLFDGGSKTCLAKAPFMMPWIVNAAGQPFWFQSAPGAQAFFSSGSATDADIQIAWAIYLAAERVKAGTWNNTTFQTTIGTLGYADIFAQMALAIRLDDIDMSTVLYIPGSQWGSAGAAVLYPGYLTPQAFAALDTIPPPAISSACPGNPPVHTPENSLQLTFTNNTVYTLSIDYLGGNGGVSVDANFVPKPGVPNGYTVAPLTSGVATFSSTNLYYANATIQAAYYNAGGQPEMESNYYFEYNNSVWTVTDKGSTSQSKSCLDNNVATVFLTQDDISAIDFAFATVVLNSVRAIQNFQNVYKTGLFPNVIYYNNQYPVDDWSNSYGYDACRYPLWVSAFVAKNPNDPNTPFLAAALGSLLTSVTPFVKNGTLPSGGINALTGQPIGNWDQPQPALNAPIYNAAVFAGDTALANALEGPLAAYDITKNQPQVTDPVGDSAPYFNAAILLLARTIQTGLL